MPKLSPLAELDAGLRIAAAEADSGATTLRVAEQFYEANHALIDPLVPGWVVQKLASMIGRYRTKLRRSNDAQLVMEGMLGFGRLPQRVETSSGGTVPRAEATIGTFRKFAASLRKQKSPVLEEAERAVELMRRYSKKKRRITWAEVLEKEAARAKR